MTKTLASLYLAKDFDPESVVCATISYEGSDREVREQMAAVSCLSRAHGGIMLGSKVGKAGYDLTYMIAYLRDFAMTYHILGESFETFVPWSKIESLIAATKKRIVAEHASRLLPGVPFVGCRVTQLYHEGACLYFYMCINFEGFVDQGSAVYADLERAAREEILKQGGSLSHHHGIGKLRSSFAKKRSSLGFGNVITSIKESMDKDNIFGARNGLFAS
jgi:alkyldihydroxyacetonephosphate synthase